MNNLKLSAFAATLFLSAALMFSLQPMIGKMLLPIVGGAPAGWIVALSFFQIMLLGGYYIAHSLSDLSPVKHAISYLGILAIGALFLPISIHSIDLSVSSSPALSVLLVLIIAVSVPFIAISATNSTIQRLFSASSHKDAKDPYFLYAASNIGSFFGLLIYPLAIEPNFNLHKQSYDWFVLYLLLILFVILCTAITYKDSSVPNEIKEEPVVKKSASKEQVSKWLYLSFIPSALLSAVTTYITTDIFSAPLIWVIPLGIYLLTFVIAFSRKQIVSPQLINKIQPPAIGLAFFIIIIADKSISTAFFSVFIHLIVFTVIALMCHIRLAEARPKDDGKLTEFYLAISVGGALGGAINAFIIPFAFNSLYEYPIFLIISCLANENIKSTISEKYLYIIIASLLAIIATITAFKYLPDYRMIYSAILAVCFIFISLHPRYALLSTSIIFTILFLSFSLSPNMYSARNFYGVIKVYNKEIDSSYNQKVEVRYMKHGTTIHGFQLTDEFLEKEPTSYYFRGSPIDTIISALNPRDIAVAGMGTGTINCYMKPSMNLTYFEIDPNVIDIAKNKFTFLSKCGNGMPSIVQGDARLKLADYKGSKFDLIVLDAFSSDTIPSHLLTKEAIEVYLSKLRTKGVLAFHISNRYFDLAPNIVTTARKLGLKNLYITVTPDKVPKEGIGSRWIVLSERESTIRPLTMRGYEPYNMPKSAKIWTDDYVDIFDALVALQ